MSSAPHKVACPLCLANNLLRDNCKVLYKTEQLYSIIYWDGDGKLTDGLITTVQHHHSTTSLSPAWGREYELHSSALGKAFGDAFNQGMMLPHNEWRNSGWVAGERITNHWHMHCAPRFTGQPGSNMGPGLLLKRFNELYWTLQLLSRAAHMDDPDAVRGAIRQALTEATK